MYNTLVILLEPTSKRSVITHLQLNNKKIYQTGTPPSTMGYHGLK